MSRLLVATSRSPSFRWGITSALSFCKYISKERKWPGKPLPLVILHYPRRFCGRKHKVKREASLRGNKCGKENHFVGKCSMSSSSSPLCPWVPREFSWMTKKRNFLSSRVLEFQRITVLTRTSLRSKYHVGTSRSIPMHDAVFCMFTYTRRQLAITIWSMLTQRRRPKYPTMEDIFKYLELWKCNCGEDHTRVCCSVVL